MKCPRPPDQVHRSEYRNGLFGVLQLLRSLEALLSPQDTKPHTMATRDLSKGYYNLNPLLSSEMKPHSHERTPERVKAIRAIVEKPHTLFPLPPGGGYGRHDYCHWRVKNDVRAHTNHCFISCSSLTFIRAFAYPDLQRQLFQAGRFPSWSLCAALCGREQQGRRDAGRQARPDHLAGDAGEIEQRNACAPYTTAFT